jgi:hypothetical protein
MKLTMAWVGTTVSGGAQTPTMSSAACLSTVWQRLRQCSVVRCCVRSLAPGDLDTPRSSVGGMLVESDICAGVHGILF